MVPDELPRDLPSFLAEFGTDAQCRAYLFARRWPQGFCCQGCGHGAAYHHRRRLIDECVACGKQHSLLAGTMFEQTKTGLARWFLAIWLVTSSKGGISAMELQRQMGFGSYQTAWSWLHKIRKAMVRPERRPLAARVEADETLIGGAKPGRPGRGAVGKTVVAGAVEAAPGKGRRRRLGRLRLKAVPDASARSLEGVPRRQRRPTRRGHHRRLAGLCRAGRGRLRPPADQPRHRLGRRGAAPARDPPRLRPRQALAARHAPRRGQQEAPPGLSRRVCLPLVWGFGCQALNIGIVFLPVSSSSRWRQPSRGLAHDVPRGARPLARIIAPQACIRWTRGDPDHDAAMRIGGEAPGRRAHSSMRHESHRKARVTATSDRHRQPAGEPWADRETVSGAPLRPSPLTPPDAGRHRPASRRWSPNATAR